MKSQIIGQISSVLLRILGPGPLGGGHYSVQPVENAKTDQTPIESQFSGFPDKTSERKCMRRFLTFFFLLTSSFTTLAVIASSGDSAFLFQQCLTKCVTEDCQDPLHPPPRLSLPLRLTRWTCEDNCKYNCMHGATDFALDQIHYGQESNGIEQFYGKWPFWRLLGIQEPASVVFSLMNFAAHYFGLKHVRAMIPEGHPMKQYIIIWGNMGLNTWIWSAVFHTRGM